MLREPISFEISGSTETRLKLRQARATAHWSMLGRQNLTLRREQGPIMYLLRVCYFLEDAYVS